MYRHSETNKFKLSGERMCNMNFSTQQIKKEVGALNLNVVSFPMEEK